MKLSFPVSFVLWALAVTGPAQAQPVDWLLSGRYVVAMDSAGTVIDDGAVVIRGDTVVEIGARTALEAKYRTRRRLNVADGLILPGLINTHTHAPMTLFRGIADDLTLQDWLERFIFPAESKMVEPDFVRWGTLLACQEMMLGGITTFADMYYFEEAVAEATVQAGMRGVLGQTLIQFPVPDAKTPAAALERATAFLRKYQQHPLISPAVAPHAVYTNSDETLQAARALADRQGAPLLIHLSETLKENEDLRAKRNLTPAQLLEKLGVLKGRTLAAHAVWVDDGDIAILRQWQTGVAHCPSSNAKLASGVAPLVKLLKAGIAVGLGTDGPAGSNNDLNLFEEIDLAAKLQKVVTRDPRSVAARAAVQMATAGGAAALGMSKQIGSLEAGKKADLIVIGLDAPHAVPLYNVYSHLAYTLKASDVRHSMIGGRWVMRDRKILTFDTAAVLDRAAKYQNQTQKILR